MFSSLVFLRGRYTRTDVRALLSWCLSLSLVLWVAPAWAEEASSISEPAGAEQANPEKPLQRTLKGGTHINESSSGKAKMDTTTLRAGVATQHARVSVDQRITLIAGATKSDTNKFLLKVDKEKVSKTVFNCFAEMTCLETAEIGSNINNAVGRWQPLLVEENPAALALGTSNPQISVKMNGTVYKIALPTFQGLKRILLATDGEQVCAMDLDSNDSWLLRLKKNPDNTLKSVQWAKLVHMKTKVESGVAVTAPKHVWDAKETSSRGWDGRATRSHGWLERPTNARVSGSRSDQGRGSSGEGGFLGGDVSRHVTRGHGRRGTSGF